MRNVYLGIDTSNYTTSTAVLHETDKSVVQQKKLLPVKQGELGLRQSDAVFHHTQQIPDLLDALWKDDYVPKAVGVSVKPRDAEGSYMSRYCKSRCKNTWYPVILVFSSKRAYWSGVIWRRPFGFAVSPFACISCVRRNHRSCVGSSR